jgi:hypothetical protein
VNVVEAEVAGTVTEGAGTGSRFLLLDKFTTVPPFGAAPLNATEQVAVAAGDRLVGLHVSDDSVMGWGATRLMVAVFEAAFRLAVRVAL